MTDDSSIVFTASCPNFLHRLSNAIGAGVENPDDLTSLRLPLTSKEILIQQGASGQEIDAVVKELSQFTDVAYVSHPAFSRSPQITKLSKFRRYRKKPSATHSNASPSTVGSRIRSPTSLDNLTSVHSQSPCRQSSHNKASGTKIGWLGRGRNAERVWFGWDTIGVSRVRSSSRSPHRCSENSVPTPGASRSHHILPARHQREQH